MAIPGSSNPVSAATPQLCFRSVPVLEPVLVLPSSQYPNLRQNTANFKLNYGLAYHLELDIDAPYLSIFRALAIPGAVQGIPAWV